MSTPRRIHAGGRKKGAEEGERGRTGRRLNLVELDSGHHSRNRGPLKTTSDATRGGEWSDNDDAMMWHWRDRPGRTPRTRAGQMVRKEESLQGTELRGKTMGISVWARSAWEDGSARSGLKMKVHRATTLRSSVVRARSITWRWPELRESLLPSPTIGALHVGLIPQTTGDDP